MLIDVTYSPSDHLANGPFEQNELPVPCFFIGVNKVITYVMCDVFQCWAAQSRACEPEPANQQDLYNTIK